MVSENTELLAFEQVAEMSHGKVGGEQFPTEGAVAGFSGAKTLRRLEAARHYVWKK